MTNRLPSDALMRPRRPLRTVLIAALALAVVIVGLWAAQAYALPAQTPKAVTATLPSAAPCDGNIVGQGICISPSQQAVADKQEQQYEAADAVAAKVAADAKAAADAAAAKKTTTQKTSGTTTTTWAPGKAPAGTPIPLHKDTDPNSGSYGQMVIEDPALFCASQSGTTGAGGVQVCA